MFIKRYCSIVDEVFLIDKKWLEYLKSKWAYLSLLAIYLVNVIYNYIWIIQDKKPPGWDDAAHLMLSLSYYQILADPGWDMIGKMVQVSSYYPPFYHFFTAFMYLLFGKSLDVALMTNSVFLGILLLSVFGIGKKIFNEEAGLVAAVLVTLYPSIFALERVYMLELPLVAMVSLSVYFLILTDHFKSLKFSIAFGITIALAVLTKWTAAFFIIGPLLCIIHDTFSPRTIEQRIALGLKSQKIEKTCHYCGKALKNNYIQHTDKNFCSKDCKKKWKLQSKNRKNAPHFSRAVNLGIAIFVSFIVASIWYIPHLSDVYNNIIIGQTFAGAAEGDPSVLTIPSIRYYILTLLDFQISPILAVLFFVGVLYLLKKKENQLLLFLWIFIPYLAFTLFRNKDYRYTLPIVGAIALISALPLVKINSKKLKAAVFSIILIIGGLQLYLMAAGMDSLSKATSVDVKDYGTFKLFPSMGYSARPLWKEDWKTADTLETITSDAINNPRTPGRMAIVLVLPDYHIINGYTFSYYAIRDNLPLYIINAAYLPSASVFYDNFLNIDYIIIKRGGDIVGNKYRIMVNDMYVFFEKNYNGKYQLIKSLDLPDNSTLSIYKNVYTG